MKALSEDVSERQQSVERGRGLCYSARFSAQQPCNISQTLITEKQDALKVQNIKINMCSQVLLVCLNKNSKLYREPNPPSRGRTLRLNEISTMIFSLLLRSVDFLKTKSAKRLIPFITQNMKGKLVHSMKLIPQVIPNSSHNS